jgi:hypothetical protein
LRHGDGLLIRHEDETLTLTKSNPIVSRPTLQPAMFTADSDHYNNNSEG